MMDEKTLRELIATAEARFNALTPEQQREHMEAQRKSWVVGELMLENPTMPRAEAEQRYKRARMEGK